MRMKGEKVTEVCIGCDEVLGVVSQECKTREEERTRGEY